MNTFKVINGNSSLPKYRQIVQSVIEGIEKGMLKKGQQLPSINELATANATAKETVTKAYGELREMGVIIARHGKGFYIAKTKAKLGLNIFVLFDTFNAYKEVLYNALKAALPSDSQFSIFFHHYHLKQFAQLINDNLGSYNYYVIMPHFDTDVSAIVNTVPRDKFLLLDSDVPKLENGYAAVYQDFENDIYNGLKMGLPLIKKYRRLHLVAGYEHLQYVPVPIVKGFKKFCSSYGIAGEVMDNLKEETLNEDEAYLIFTDTDMIRFIKYCDKMKWRPGKEIGLISYDDTPLKEILLGGVTVISTDFAKMGKTAGELISGKKVEKIANDSLFIKRKTL
ncbi:MAG: GntR family transcriptional regulator [Chitinophagaceae bacterium]|nr:GntR family transcriptional regulator [Chitinophagaceae bacterium]